MDASGELAVIQRGICAALFKQFLMRALFNDIAVFHEQNTVCVAEMKPRLNWRPSDHDNTTETVILYLTYYYANMELWQFNLVEILFRKFFGGAIHKFFEFGSPFLNGKVDAGARNTASGTPHSFDQTAVPLP